MARIRVLVVEDSATQRAGLVRAIESSLHATVVGEAADAGEAVAAVARHRPDVVTLDLEIPSGRRGVAVGGLQAIREIMWATPTPILVVSAHVDHPGSTAAMEALAAGAADALAKPAQWTASATDALQRRLQVVRGVGVIRRQPGAPPARRPRSARPPDARPRGSGSAQAVIGLGASTGGPLALQRVLARLRGTSAAILVVQHLNPDFDSSFASWLGATTGFPVELARAGILPRPGHVYVGCGGAHLGLGSGGVLSLSPRPETLHRPSVDALFASMAASAGPAAAAAVLTGMGEDGARGLLEVHLAGGVALAQDEASCTVYGMPRAALAIGAVKATTPIDEIGGRLLAWARRQAC